MTPAGRHFVLSAPPLLTAVQLEGLDDFADAADGPSAIDLVRFLGSIDLVSGAACEWRSESDPRPAPRRVHARLSEPAFLLPY
jgi:hypothetical protein